MSVLDDAARVESLTVLSRFRTEFYGCLTARADALFELTDAVLCTDGPVKTLVELSLAPEHRRGHGALYDGLNQRPDRRRPAAHGRWPACRCRGPPTGGSCWRSMSAPGCARTRRPARSGCSATSTAAGEEPGADDPGLAVLVRRRAGDRAAPPGPRCWTRSGSARPTTRPRSPPPSSATSSTGSSPPGTGSAGDPDILIVVDAGYDVTRLAFLLADLPVELLGRMRSDRVLRLPAPPRLPGTSGRPPQARRRVRLRRPDDLARPGGHHHHRHHPLRHRRRQRLGPAAPPADPPRRLARPRRRPPGHRGHPDPAAGRAPARRPRPETGVAVVLTHRRHRRATWTGSGRRSCADSTWNTPSGCSNRPSAGPPRSSATPTPPTAGPGSIIAAHTQLRLARHLTEDLRRPWERPAPPGRLTPARVRRGFRNLRAKTAHPAGAPKPAQPGPGRPPGSKNHRPPPRHDVGKTAKRDLTITARKPQTG